MNNTIQRNSTAFAFVVLTGFMLSFGACKKDNTAGNNADETTVTEEEVAQLTTEGISPDNGGFVAQAENSAMICTLSPMICGAVKDSTVGGASAAGAARSYSYMLDWHYTLECDGSIPKQLSFAFKGNSSFDGPHISSEDSCSGGFEMMNLLSTYTTYKLNATYMRMGSQVSKTGHKGSFTSTMTIVATDVIIDKLTRQIKSGTATVAVSGKSGAGKSFSFGGTLVFNGDRTARLVLNSGATYGVTW